MKRVLTAVILIPIVVLALFRAPLWLFTLLVLGVALLAAGEYFDIAEKTGSKPFRGLSYFFVCLLFAVTYLSISGVFFRAPFVLGTWTAVVGQICLSVLFLSPLIFMAASMRRDPLSRSLPDAAVSFLLLPYVGLTLLCLIVLRESDLGALFLLFLMLLVWSGDIAAYYVGRAMGRHKLAARISPGKTWEGAIASAIGAIAIAVLLFKYLQPVYFALKQIHLAPESLAPIEASVPVIIVIAFAICVNVAAQLGDLVESMLKRGAGLKDSGSLLPGHGGVLDRIDALLFALPIGCFFYFALLSKYFHGAPYID